MMTRRGWIVIILSSGGARSTTARFDYGCDIAERLHVRGILGYDAIMRDYLAPTPAMRIHDNAAKGELFHFCRRARPDA